MCLSTWNMKPNVFGNLSKTILNNIMNCNILPFLWTLKKMYIHWIYKLTTSAQVKPWPIRWGRTYLMHIIKEMSKGHMKWQDDYMRGITLSIKDFQIGATGKLLCIFVIVASIGPGKILTINLRNQTLGLHKISIKHKKQVKDVGRRMVMQTF